MDSAAGNVQDLSPSAKMAQSGLGSTYVVHTIHRTEASEVCQSRHFPKKRAGGEYAGLVRRAGWKDLRDDQERLRQIQADPEQSHGAHRTLQLPWKNHRT